MEGCRSNCNGDVELVLSFPTQLESPKTESESQSYDQNGEAAEAVCGQFGGTGLSAGRTGGKFGGPGWAPDGSAGRPRAPD